MDERTEPAKEAAGQTESISGPVEPASSTVHATGPAESAEQIAGPTQQADQANRRRDLLDIRFGVLGAVGLILSAATPVIAEFEMPGASKILWIAGVAVMATLFGVALYGFIVAALFPNDQRNIGRRLRFVALVATILIGGALFVVSSSSAVSYGRTCLAPGEGGNEYESAFFEAFTRNGGVAELGCPITPVKPLEGGYHQNLAGHPKGPAVIFAVSPSSAVALDPDEWFGYHQIQGPVESTVAAGYPFGDAVSLRDGKYLQLGAGNGNWRRSAIIKKRENRWYWVQGGMWEGYRDRFGGPEGPYGYPIAEQELTPSGKSQQFEYGRLYFSPNRGVQTQAEFESGTPGAAVPSLSLGRAELVYRVDSAGGTPHEMPKLSYVEQSFRATTPIIDKVGAIVGLNPADASPVAHQLLFKLLDGDRVIATSDPVDLVNNALTVATFPPTQVEVERVYKLQVTNLSEDILGFYLNDPGKPNQQADRAARARLVGELVRPEPYLHSNHALSALIQGRKPS